MKAGQVPQAPPYNRRGDELTGLLRRQVEQCSPRPAFVRVRPDVWDDLLDHSWHVHNAQFVEHCRGKPDIPEEIRIMIDGIPVVCSHTIKLPFHLVRILPA